MDGAVLASFPGPTQHFVACSMESVLLCNRKRHAGLGTRLGRYCTVHIALGMKFTRVVFSCKQYVGISSSYTCQSPGKVYISAGTEVLNQVPVLEIDVRRQRSSVPSKSLKDGPKMTVFRQEQALLSTTKATSTGAGALGLATTIAVG